MASSTPGWGPTNSLIQTSYGTTDELVQNLEVNANGSSVAPDNRVRTDSIDYIAKGIPYGATFAIGQEGMTIDHVYVTGGRCGGVAISGPGLVLQNSIITGNGYHNGRINQPDTQCYTVPTSSGIYLHPADDQRGRNMAPSIYTNTIYHNYGMGLDNDSVYGGTFRNNIVYDNDSWAGVSLYMASNWTITNNDISEPAIPITNTSIHTDCWVGPNGDIGTAAIRLCHDQITNDPHVVGNVISNNRLNATGGYYGILSIGGDENPPPPAQPYVPIQNTFTGNDPTGSVHGCADDYPAGLPLSNIWSGNYCYGDGNPPHDPDHF